MSSIQFKVRHKQQRNIKLVSSKFIIRYNI